VGGQGSIPVRRGSISVLTTDVLAPDFLTVWADGVDKTVIYDPRRSASRSRPDCRSFIKRKLGGKWWTKPHPDDGTIHTRLSGSFGFSRNSLAITYTTWNTLTLWIRIYLRNYIRYSTHCIPQEFLKFPISTTPLRLGTLDTLKVTHILWEIITVLKSWSWGARRVEIRKPSSPAMPTHLHGSIVSILLYIFILLLSIVIYNYRYPSCALLFSRLFSLWRRAMGPLDLSL